MSDITPEEAAELRRSLGIELNPPDPRPLPAAQITPEEATTLRKQLGIEVHTHPSGQRVTMGDVTPRLAHLLDALAPERRAFLSLYRTNMKVTETACKLKMDVASHYYYKKHDALYLEAYKLIVEEQTEALEETLHDRVQKGQREEYFEVDEEGNEVLKTVKVKHDAAYLKMALAARKPELYGGHDKGASSINIVIQVVNE